MKEKNPFLMQGLAPAPPKVTRAPAKVARPAVLEHVLRSPDLHGAAGAGTRASPPLPRRRRRGHL